MLAASHQGWCTDTSLDAAFVASLGQRGPLARAIQVPVYDRSQPPKVLKTERHVFSVRPERLVELGHGRYALVSYETDVNGKQSMPGAIAVAYLERTETRWTLE